MPTQFDDLPVEIQHEIFKLVANSEFSPRVVEIYFKAGQIYSKTLPPPLLHVCRLSRDIILELYKPWLPQFKERLVHKPWERKIENKDVDRLSRLQNVCVSLEHDILLINDRQWSEWNFGPIERSRLRRLAVNVGGWFGWLRQTDFYMQFTHLRNLNLFDHAEDHKLLSFKINEIQKVLAKAQKDSMKNQGIRRKYRAPAVSRQEIPTAVGWQGSVEDWITYKHPKGYTLQVASGPRRPRRREVVEEKQSMPSETNFSTIRTLPTRQAAKRSRMEYEAGDVPKTSRKPRRIARGRPRKSVTYDTEEHQTPRRETPLQLSAHDSLAKIRETTELLQRPSSESKFVWKSAASPDVDEIPLFQNPLDKYDFLRDFINHCPETLEVTPGPFLAVTDPRVVFHNHFENLVDLGLGDGDQSNSDICYNDIHMPVESYESMDSFSFSSTEDLVSDDSYFESLSGRDGYEQVVEPNSSSTLQSGTDKDNDIHGSEGLIFEGPDVLASELESPQSNAPASEGEEMEYTPKQFMAERKAAQGLQYLIQWEDYPDEKDWTWETESAMMETVPNMVMSWAARSDVEAEEEKPITMEYIVERILGRRKFKGVPHYLVKWKGYEAVKDRTWEPCDRLRIDVPLIVDAFEEKKKK